MTQDEIAQAMQDSAGNSWGNEAHFQRFAALIANAEREACKQIIRETQFSNWFQADLIEAIDKRGQA
jgi:hypothetical protein